MRESEIPYLAAGEAIELWIAGKDPAPALKGVPPHLVDMVQISAKIQCQNIAHWAKQKRRGKLIPKNIEGQVDAYLRSKGYEI